MHRKTRTTLIAAPLLAALACSSAARPDAETPASTDGTLRIATWNIRYFPEDSVTDLDRVAEILAGLDADVVAVQEIRDSVRLAGLLDTVNARLAADADAGRGRGRSYTYALAESGGNGNLFVGCIYDSLAVEVPEFHTVWKLQMNPDLRPGLAVHVKSRHGGFDFEMVVMHTDSGVRDRDYQNRLRFLDSLAVVLPELRKSDADVIVLGDLNTMGRDADGGLPAVPARDEIENLDRTLAGLGLRRLPNDPDCTEYYQGRGSHLDHIIVASATEEAPADLVVHVGGYCGEVSCGRLDPDDMPRDFVRASDHCPLVVDLVDADRD